MRPRKLLLLSAVVAAGIAGYALLAPSGLPKLRHKERELAQLQSDVARLESENARLLTAAHRLKEGTAPADIYLEDAAREELGWLEPDEHVLLLPSASDERRARPEDASSAAPPPERVREEAP